MGEAEARRDAGIREAIAEEQRMAARYTNDAEIAKAQRDFELKKAMYDLEVQTKKATSDMAYHLQAAKTKQAIKEEEMQIKVVERGQSIQVQDQEIQRKEKELEAMVKKPAEALKFKRETLAEADKSVHGVCLICFASYNEWHLSCRKRVEIEAEASAQAIRMKGDAEAYAIEAKAKAEAEQMAKKADAWKDYQDAAMVDMVLETLPKIAAEVAAPLSQAKKITMISSGNGEVGAAKLTGEVLQVMEKLPQVVEGMTGVNISKVSIPPRVHFLILHTILIAVFFLGIFLSLFLISGH